MARPCIDIPSYIIQESKSANKDIEFPAPEQLYIRYSKARNAGNYSCRAINRLGSDSDSVDVVVMGM